MILSEMPFEDFTLILSRNCNLSCKYCPLKHFEGKMSCNTIRFFFDKLFEFDNYKFNITLFGGEPLLNKKGISFIYEYLIKNKDIILSKNLYFKIKIITNGTLINNYFIELFDKFNKLNNLDFLIDISIDGNKDTQLSQRNYKKGFVDYYLAFTENIKKIISLGIKIDLFLVMDFNNKKIIYDIIYLVKTFNVPVFIMPVDLTHEYIKLNKENISNLIKKYIELLQKNLNIIKKYGLYKMIANFRVKVRRDIKIPPIGPTVDYLGDLYTTRDFLFLMDKESRFTSIGNIKQINFNEMLDFFKNNFKKIEQDALYTYYGKSYLINKKIGDYFTELVFGKN